MAILPNDLRVVDFDSPERTKQLEIIDKLHDLGVGREISLPVLVVVGDQSSGKSSLLDGLTALPFPVASQLCTRFATQVSFRRSATNTNDVISISIVPATDAEDEYKDKLFKFGRELEELSSETFNGILAEAAKLMGLPSTPEESEVALKRFSRDVLKIEIVGPHQHHLSVVDVPGLYHNPTKAQTLEDLAIIRSLIEEYVNDPRTIIILAEALLKPPSRAVLDSRNNLANQEVFKIARTADPSGTRTIGVMTKLDALQQGDEQAAIEIARNEVEFLKHGWYCVRNRSTQEINDGVSIQERNRREKEFFSKAPWNKIDQKRTGIAHLKTNLGRLLSNHIAREFPDIRKEIDVRHFTCCKQLEDLGAPRQSTQEQRQHLTKIATVYQRAIEDASNGRYKEAGHHPSKLRMHLQNASDRFNQIMEARGKTMAFKSTDDEFQGQVDERNTTPTDSSVDYASSTEDASDQENAEPQKIKDSKKPSDIYEEIQKLWRSSRGTELPGHVNPSVLETLFNHQTTSWPLIANKHLEKVISAIMKCHSNVFKESCSDEIVRNSLWAKIEPDAHAAFEAARVELTHLLNDERYGPLLTNNHYYADNLAKARADRFVNGLKRLGFKDLADNYVNFNTIKNSMHLSNEQTAIYDIHDTLQAYYKVAQKRFVDNVANQVVERNLMGPKGPVSILTPEWVAGLDAEDLVDIAGEDPATSSQREELNATIRRLEKAKKVCSGKTNIS
ncbi:hypothetical protein MMC11_000404 [Xylographa trunciseda]|nr:hypothetical protein [Xylographa trunciseda]